MISRNRFAQIRLLSAAAAVAGAQLLLATSALAAPAEYATEVLGDNPYLFFRFQETGTLVSPTPADDLGTRANVADGVYRGNAVGGATGAGTSSDTAVSFPGITNNPDPMTAAALDYVRTTNALDFGSLVGQSSYEVIFKSNTVNPTNYQSIFGVFNQSDANATPPRTNTGAVAIEFNSTATGNPTDLGTSRFYLRDENNRALGAVIDNGVLLDGNYHHLVFTFDYTAAATTDLVKAYVDGASVPVTLVQQGIGLPTAGSANFLPFNRDPIFGARNLRGVVGNEADVTIDEGVLYTSVLTPQQVLDHAIAAGLAAAPALPGDTNDDGVVDLTDLNNVLNNFGAAGAGNPGDDNGDNTVDLTDLNNVLNNFGSTGAAAALSVVPEPATASLLALGALATLARRRRA